MLKTLVVHQRYGQYGKDEIWFVLNTVRLFDSVSPPHVCTHLRLQAKRARRRGMISSDGSKPSCSPATSNPAPVFSSTAWCWARPLEGVVVVVVLLAPTGPLSAANWDLGNTGGGPLRCEVVSMGGAFEVGELCWLLLVLRAIRCILCTMTMAFISCWTLDIGRRRRNNPLY